MKPTLREKKRYVLIDQKDMEGIIINTFAKLYGSVNLAKAGILFVKKNIIRVNNKYVDHLKSSLLFINLKSIKVSGTLKSLQRGG